MSQITVLGFTPAQLASSESANAIHWSILLRPNSAESPITQSTATTRPKAKSFFSSQRRLSKEDSNKASSPDTALFDIQNHQLRQQEFPVAIKSSEASGPHRTTTSISSDIPNKPFTLSLRIHLAIHPLTVSTLASQVSTLLYRTPTYGSEEDWLRAALDMLVGSSILKPSASFDADLLLAFAGQAVKDYLCQIEQGRHSEHEVLDLDYAKHLREMNAVRAMFSHDPPAVSTNGLTRPRPQPVKRSSHQYPVHYGSKTKASADVQIKTHKFLGFTISPSPSAVSPRQRWASGGEKRAYFERHDDPYGGLM